MPPEYCRYGTTKLKCQEWLKEEDEELYNKIYPSEALSQKISDMSVEECAQKEKEMEKQREKESRKEDKEKKKKAIQKVVIKKIDRTKKKSTVTINGLEQFGVELKKIAKKCANKFACGASVSKNPQGLDEIVIQGDVLYEISDLLLLECPELTIDNIDIKE